MTPLASETPAGGDLPEELLRDAPAIRAGGNAPLVLEAGGAWRVEAGKVEVFAWEGRGGGMRLHLATIPAGGMLFGAGEVGGLTLLAVGSRDSRLLDLGGERLRSGTPELARALAPLLDGWISHLLGESLRAAPPKAFVELREGEETRLEREGMSARPREGVAWVRCVEGSCWLLGRRELALAPGEVLPVPETGWLTGSGQSVLSAATTLDLLRAGEDWEAALGRFHQMFLTYAALHLAEEIREDRARLERKAGLDRATLGSAYSRLAAVLTRVPPRETGLDDISDPLLATCRLVGQSQGIPFRPPVETGGRRKSDQLAAICAASRVRYRRVILRGDWWRHDNGPLMGFVFLDEQQRQHRAVALLPASPRSYELVDPVEGVRKPVDAATAETLSGEAYMFYPPLPDRAVSPWDLARLALQDRRSDLLTIVLMGVAGGLLGLLLPIITGEIFGRVIPGASRSQLLPMVLALMVGALATAVFQITRSIAVLRLGGKMDGSVQSAVWDRLLGLPADFFRRYSVGDLSNRSMGIDTIRELLTGNVVTSVLAAIFSLFSFALLFYYSWRLALLATGLVIVLVATTMLLVWLQVRRQRELLRIQGTVSSLLFGLLAGIAKLRVGGAVPRAFALWAQRFAEQRELTIRAQRIANVQTTVSSSYGVVTSLALFAMMGFYSEASLPVGDFLAFNAAFGQFLAAALGMIGVFSSVLTIIPLYERLSPILQEIPEVDATKAEAGDLTGEVELSHVSFRYPGEGPLILDGVSFRAGPGEFIALVGPSGAGKSTCLRLILGFEQPTSGSIYFDGQDLASLSPQSVRRQLGVVLQSGRPMVGDIFTTIVGNSNLTLEDAWEAARMAGLEEDIKAMPMGMHTVISEGGETFSGGQKQRLLIARAIVHRPRIVLFDEATSALDNRTQEIVSRSLERLKATRIVIAHRLSTIVNADRIYVMQAGRVVEVGTYEELLRRGGVFAQLAARQIA
ncbi:MAG TPA: NHLP bacteriocin export ABC transporter permease/ATPase subunit [Thermoanaerobaculia bacterium]